MILRNCRQETDVNEMYRNYHIEDLTKFDKNNPDNHGRIIYFTLNTIFNVQIQFFLREVIRLSNFKILYYRLFHSDFYNNVSFCDQFLFSK